MIVGVASGKGGTGKTTVAVHLACSAPGPATLLDCDVEAPNCRLFLRPSIVRREAVCIPVPVLEEAKCTGCGLCADICEYNAVAVLGGRLRIYPELCHGCGGCVRVCPHEALVERGAEIGVIEVGEARGLEFVEGRLHVGRALSPPLIRAVKRFARSDGLTVVDSPPGTSCPFAAAIAGCDYAVLVVEPTRFGLHDFGLVAEAVARLGVPAGVVVNRAGAGSGMVSAECERRGIEVLLEIPEDREIARACARGRIAAESLPWLARSFEELGSKIGRAACEPRAAAGGDGIAHVRV